MTLHSFLAVSADYLFSPPASPMPQVRAPELTALYLTRELARVKAWRRLTTGETKPTTRQRDLAENAAG